MVQHHEGCNSRIRGGEQGIAGVMRTSSGARSASAASSLEEMQNQNEGTLWGQVPINPGRMPCSWIVLCDLHTIAHLNRFLRGYTGIPIKTMKLLESIIACNYLLCVGQLVTSLGTVSVNQSCSLNKFTKSEAFLVQFLECF